MVQALPPTPKNIRFNYKVTSHDRQRDSGGVDILHWVLIDSLFVWLWIGRIGYLIICCVVQAGSSWRIRWGFRVCREQLPSWPARWRAGRTYFWGIVQGKGSVMAFWEVSSVPILLFSWLPPRHFWDIHGRLHSSVIIMHDNMRNDKKIIIESY